MAMRVNNCKGMSASLQTELGKNFHWRRSLPATLLKAVAPSSFMNVFIALFYFYVWLLIAALKNIKLIKRALHSLIDYFMIFIVS